MRATHTINKIYKLISFWINYTQSWITQAFCFVHNASLNPSEDYVVFKRSNATFGWAINTGQSSRTTRALCTGFRIWSTLYILYRVWSLRVPIPAVFNINIIDSLTSREYYLFWCLPQMSIIIIHVLSEYDTYDTLCRVPWTQQNAVYLFTAPLQCSQPEEGSSVSFHSANCLIGTQFRVCNKPLHWPAFDSTARALLSCCSPGAMALYFTTASLSLLRYTFGPLDVIKLLIN